MDYFGGCRVFRYNHVRNYRNLIDRRIETWTLNYAHSGALYFSVDGGEPRLITGPAAFWTWPGPHYRYWPASSEGWDHYYVSWYGPRATAWQRRGLHPKGRPDSAVRPVSDPAQFRAAFEMLLGTLKSRPRNDPMVVHQLEGLLMQLHVQTSVAREESSVLQSVRDIAEAVKANPQRAWDFAAEADHVGCTPTHFRRIWKALTGVSPLTYLNKTRMDLAAELLRRDKLHLQAIASTVGFEDVSYFSRLFRRFQGMSPGTYRDVYHTLE